MRNFIYKQMNIVKRSARPPYNEMMIIIIMHTTTIASEEYTVRIFNNDCAAEEENEGVAEFYIHTHTHIRRIVVARIDARGGCDSLEITT